MTVKNNFKNRLFQEILRLVGELHKSRLQLFIKQKKIRQLEEKTLKVENLEEKKEIF